MTRSTRSPLTGSEPTRPMRVLSVFGTRPEAIKMAPVIHELRSRGTIVESRTCVTAQHRGMLDQVLSLFGIHPDVDLNIMRDGQTPTEVAAAVLSGLEPTIRAEQPDWILVQGDTTTAMAAALAAFYSRVKVGHVEAGLRTHNRFQPFPEEINRRMVTLVADMHFAPTEHARDNLTGEGIPARTIRVTGNTVIDALRMLTDAPYDPTGGPLAGVPWEKKLVLVTAHRRENFGKGIENICEALLDIVERGQDGIHVVYPVHPNPNIREPVHRILGHSSSVSLIEPLDYLPFVYLLRHSTLVLTDSGGIQEEAPGLGKPVLVLRDVTERPEAVQAGTVRLVGTDREVVSSSVQRLLENADEYRSMARAVNPYGDGHAAPRIVESLLQEEAPET